MQRELAGFSVVTKTRSAARLPGAKILKRKRKRIRGGDFKAFVQLESWKLVPRRSKKLRRTVLLTLTGNSPEKFIRLDSYAVGHWQFG